MVVLNRIAEERLFPMGGALGRNVRIGQRLLQGGGRGQCGGGKCERECGGGQPAEWGIGEDVYPAFFGEDRVLGRC